MAETSAVLLWAGRPALRPFVLLVLLWDLLSCRMSCFEEFWNFHDFKTFCPVECPALRPFVMLWDLLSCQMSCFEEFWSFYDFETFCPAECPALNKFWPFMLLDVLFSEDSISCRVNFKCTWFLFSTPI